MANEVVPFWDLGSSITASAGAAVTGKRFVQVNGARVNGLPRVIPCGAGIKPFGVACRDKAAGEAVMCYTGPGIVVPVTAGAALAAGQEVQSDATGQAIVLAAGRPAGMTLDDAAIGADAVIKLY